MFCFVLFLLRVGDVALFGFVHVPASVLHQLFCRRINIPTQTLSWGPNLKKKCTKICFWVCSQMGDGYFGLIQPQQCL